MAQAGAVAVQAGGWLHLPQALLDLPTADSPRKKPWSKSAASTEPMLPKQPR